MKWTKQRPTVSGFYWMKIEQPNISAIHHQGPLVLDVTVDEDGLEVGDPGGDYARSIEEYEEQEEVTIGYWSDEPIFPPDKEE